LVQYAPFIQQGKVKFLLVADIHRLEGWNIFLI